MKSSVGLLITEWEFQKHKYNMGSVTVIMWCLVTSVFCSDNFLNYHGPRHILEDGIKTGQLFTFR
jgi:hypothetical protein